MAFKIVLQHSWIYSEKIQKKGKIQRRENWLIGKHWHLMFYDEFYSIEEEEE